jgi:transposase-like protein
VTGEAVPRKKKHDAAFKAKVALAAIMCDKPLKELSQIYSVHPSQISEWKSQLIKRAQVAFEQRLSRVSKE